MSDISRVLELLYFAPSKISFQKCLEKDTCSRYWQVCQVRSGP